MRTNPRSSPSLARRPAHRHRLQRRGRRAPLVLTRFGDKGEGAAAVCHGDMSDEGTCKLVTGRAMTNWSAARWRGMRAPRATSCSRRSRTRTSALGLAGLAPQRCDRLVRGPVRYRHHGPGDGDDATSQQHPSIHPSSIHGGGPHGVLQGRRQMKHDILC